jgi:HK97 family phage major capsid protein
MAATLAEIREEFKAKQDRLGEVFAQAGPDLDLTKVDLLEGDSRARRDQVKAMNDELAVLGKDVEELNSLDNMRAQNAMVLDGLNRPVSGMIHPGAPTGRMEEIKSLAQRVVESEVITGYNSSRKQSPSVDMAAPELFGQRNAVTTETSYAPQAVRIPLILPGALRRPVVADLIPDGRTDQIAIVFMEETTTTNAAAAVAEGGAKPESTLVFTERTSPVRKIATVLPVTDELINDVSAMRAYLEARMRLFLMLAEETSLLSGNGSPDLTGFLNTANTQTQA